MEVAEFLDKEEHGFEGLERLTSSMTNEEAEATGYAPGWSVKDMLAHVAGWLSLAGIAVEQFQAGTFRPEDRDVDAQNQAFVDANRDQPLDFVRLEVTKTRHRLRSHVHRLPAIPPELEPTLLQDGPEHYAQHVPRLAEWLAELRART